MTKINSILKFITVLAFLMVLTINIQLTLTETFIGIGNEVLAQSSCTGSVWTEVDVICGDCAREVQGCFFDEEGSSCTPAECECGKQAGCYTSIKGNE